MSLDERLSNPIASQTRWNPYSSRGIQCAVDSNVDVHDRLDPVIASLYSDSLSSHHT